MLSYDFADLLLGSCGVIIRGSAVVCFVYWQLAWNNFDYSFGRPGLARITKSQLPKLLELRMLVYCSGVKYFYVENSG
jgi:hypothetical protein